MAPSRYSRTTPKIGFDPNFEGLDVLKLGKVAR